jgi:hypothetical protein
MASEIRSWTRQGEAFWRAHHEAWKRSDLNQRQYCEAEGIPSKAFGNWRAKFKAEPQLPERKLLYRRRGFHASLSANSTADRGHRVRAALFGRHSRTGQRGWLAAEDKPAKQQRTAVTRNGAYPPGSSKIL